MTTVTREAFLAAKPGTPEPLNVRGLGTVHIRAMSTAQRAEWELAATRDRKITRELLAIFTVCDDAGQPLFTRDDLAALGEVDAAILDAIFARAMRVNRITNADVDELEGN